MARGSCGKTPKKDDTGARKSKSGTNTSGSRKKTPVRRK